MERNTATWQRVTAVVLLVFVLAFAGVLAGCASSEPSRTPGPDGSEETSSADPGTAPSTDSTEPVVTSVVKAYFMDVEKVAPVSGSAIGKGVASAAMELLLAGPDPSQSAMGLTTMIPAGTELLGVSIADKVATVDLSSEFTSGGGTLSMTGRVAQVVFTLTQFPTVDAVLFEVEGEPLDVLGGEGVILDSPRTRETEEPFAPEVLIESPTWGAMVPAATGLRVRGSANVFEAVFQLEIADATGKIVRTQQVMATSGSGTRGTFDATLSLAGVKPGAAKIVGSYLSAKDGSRVVVTEVPVTIR